MKEFSGLTWRLYVRATHVRRNYTCILNVQCTYSAQLKLELWLYNPMQGGRQPQFKVRLSVLTTETL